MDTEIQNGGLSTYTLWNLKFKHLEAVGTYISTLGIHNSMTGFQGSCRIQWLKLSPATACSRLAILLRLRFGNSDCTSWRAQGTSCMCPRMHIFPAKLPRLSGDPRSCANTSCEQWGTPSTLYMDTRGRRCMIPGPRLSGLEQHEFI